MRLLLAAHGDTMLVKQRADLGHRVDDEMCIRDRQDGQRALVKARACADSRLDAGAGGTHQHQCLDMGQDLGRERLIGDLLVETLVLMGATGPRIEAAVRGCAGFDESALTILHADSMQHAVELARGAAQPGAVVSALSSKPAHPCLLYTSVTRATNRRVQEVRLIPRKVQDENEK